MKSKYRGRFAPSPTGALHLGSLTTALASYLDARKNNGAWLVRIEDIDPLREETDASERILKCLESHELHWDEPVIYQSQRSEQYHVLVERFLKLKQAYYCPCSRKQLSENGGKHTPQCRQTLSTQSDPMAIRIAVDNCDKTWTDRVLGKQQFALSKELDDFIIQRKEGFYAYHLAVIHDDIDQNITHIVRGEDLLDSTPFHLRLYDLLDTRPPEYAHTPIVKNELGQKLSKQNKAPAIDNDHPHENIIAALTLLHMPPPSTLIKAPIKELLTWAVETWDIQKLVQTTH